MENAPASLAQFLEWIRKDRADWDAALSQLQHEQMEKPGVTGDWSVKDVIAHVIWFEREMVNLLESRSLAAGSPLWYKDQNERNRMIYEENRERSLQDVIAESESIYQKLFSLIENLDESDLFDPDRLSMPADWKPWQILAENTCYHYRDHARDIRAWLEQRSPEK